MIGVVLFGKLPAHGDFVARGIDAARQDALDAAISRSMQLAMTAFGDTFEDRFLAAPPWRCAVPHDAGFLGGALAPSLDRAGRLYPVFLAGSAPSLATARHAAAACEGLLFTAIPEQWSADRLWDEARAAVDSTAAADQTDDVVPSGWWLDGGEALDRPAPLLAGSLPQQLLLEMIAVTEQIA